MPRLQTFCDDKKLFSKISSKADCKKQLRDFTMLNSCKINWQMKHKVKNIVARTGNTLLSTHKSDRALN